jgi:hypothetical protein
MPLHTPQKPGRELHQLTEQSSTRWSEKNEVLEQLKKEKKDPDPSSQRRHVETAPHE